MSTLRNHVQLLGFIGNDPEVRTTNTGKKVANFSIATTDNYRDANGQWQSETTWHNVNCWEGLAERVEQQVKKGSYLLLQGKLMYRKYTDNNQIERTVAEIRLDSFVTLDRNSKTSVSESTPDVYMQPSNESFKDDLPF